MSILKSIPVLLFILSSCAQSGENWIRDCEDAFKYRLKSPSSYQRISSFVTHRRLSIEEYLAANPQLVQAQVIDIRERKPDLRMWYVVVTYDAANSYNAKLRGTFSCEQITDTGNPPTGGASDTVKKLLMKVDGVAGKDYPN